MEESTVNKSALKELKPSEQYSWFLIWHCCAAVMVICIDNSTSKDFTSHSLLRMNRNGATNVEPVLAALMLRQILIYSAHISCRTHRYMSATCTAELIFSDFVPTVC